MRYGYVTPNSWGIDDPGQTVDLAVRAEELGFDSLWVSHHVLHRGFVKERLGTGPYHDPLVMLTAFAMATSRVRLGTSVLVLPYLHPMPTAKTVATIDHLSQGRVDLGVGVGGLEAEHEIIDMVPFAERGTYADAFLDVMTGLWRPGPSSYDGPWFSHDEVEAYPGAFGREIPILVGGNGAAAVRRAVRFGAGWQGIGLEPAAVGPVRDRLHQALAEGGRATDGFRMQVRLHPSIDELNDDAWARSVAAYEAAGIDELLLGPLTGDVDEHVRWLETLAGTLS